MDDLPLDRRHRLELLPLARLANLVGHPQRESLESRLAPSAVAGGVDDDLLPLLSVRRASRSR